MEVLDKYSDLIKQQPKLFSETEINHLLEKSTDTSRSYNLVKISAIAALILLLVGIPLFLKYTAIEDEGYYASYYDYRYEKLIEEVQKDSVAYQSNIVPLTKNNSKPLYLNKAIKPSKSILEKLGFVFLENGVVYEGNIDTSVYLKIGILNGKATVLISSGPDKQSESKDFYPLFLSEINGRQGVKFRFHKEPEEKLEDAFFEEQKSALIPILVEDPNFEKQMIFWFLPTESFFQIIENENVEPEVTKTNFDKKNKQDFKIYPNPAKRQIYFKNNSNDKLLEVQLLDLNGHKIQNLSIEGTSEDDVYEAAIDQIPNGVYMLEIEFKNKPKVFRRVIIQNP